MQVCERIEKLREIMAERGIDAYIVPTDDFHASEYVGDYFKTRSYITGFTGSAGTAVILKDSAGLWTDGRYFLQAADELEGSGVTLFKQREPGVPEIEKYLSDKLASGSTLGFDGRVITADFMKKIEKAFTAAGKNFQIQSEDLIGKIWADRPALSCEKAFSYSIEFAGESRESKLQKLAAEVKKCGADIFLVAALDDIAYLLNIRGADVECNPVVLSYLVINAGKPVLFVQRAAIADIKAELEAAGVEIREYGEVYDYVRLNAPGCCVAIDSGKTNYELIRAAKGAGKTIYVDSHKLIRKHIKNPTEVEGMAYAHLKDGVAKTRWIYWLKTNIGKIAMDEISVAEKLHEFRSQQENFMGDSFEPIMGYGPHGAIVHYSATPKSASKLEPKGFLLADTGGQYLEGTTDVTRTIALGPLTEVEKQDYASVLRGHLALQNLPFKRNTTGYELDERARKPIDEVGKPYNHGTGHGVGVFLNVHEDPVRISASANIDFTFSEGMITSDEPGIYVEGSHGIRIENLEVCLPYMEYNSSEHTASSNATNTNIAANSNSACAGASTALKFEPLTLIPYDRDAVDPKLLSEQEKKWFNDYQQLVFEKIAPLLEKDEAEWLKAETAPI